MSGAGARRETEIKLRVASAADARRLLRFAEFRVARRRVFESNVLYDNAARDLRARRCLIRIRRAGTRAILTYKGTPEPGRYKSREELDATLAQPEAFEAILARLGFEPVFRYEKFRTEYQRDGTGEVGAEPVYNRSLTVAARKRETEPRASASGLPANIVCLDETPIGVFLELEGAPEWIDPVADQLGFAEKDYILDSYATLYINHCRERGCVPGDMVFQTGKLR